MLTFLGKNSFAVLAAALTFGSVANASADSHSADDQSILLYQAALALRMFPPTLQLPRSLVPTPLAKRSIIPTIGRLGLDEWVVVMKFLTTSAWSWAIL